MPLYEYACGACGHRFEKLQNRDAGPPEQCPKCDALGTLARAVSQTSFQLKGSGWYVTDYKSPDVPPSNTSDHVGEGVSADDPGEPSKPSTAAGESVSSSSDVAQDLTKPSSDQGASSTVGTDV